MKAAMIKDFMILKGQLKVICFIMIVFLISSIATSNGSMLAYIVFFLSISLVMSLFSEDERFHWDKFGISTPITRKSFIFARYTLSFLIIFFSCLIYFIVNWSFSQFALASLKENIVIVLAISTVGLVMLGLLLPVMYKLGSMKGRYAFGVIFLMPTVIIMVAVTWGEKNNFDFSGITNFLTKVLEQMMGLVVLGGLAVFVVSLLCSVHIYNRKQF